MDLLLQLQQDEQIIDFSCLVKTKNVNGIFFISTTHYT